MSVSLGAGAEGSHRLLELSIRTGSQNTRGMIDSGATHNFVSDKLVAQLQLAVRRYQMLLVRLANGKTVSSTGVVELECVLSDGLVQSVLCYVVPELTCPIVLGMPWLREHNPRIDWATGTVEFQQSGCVYYCQGEGYTSKNPEDAAHVELCGLKAVLKASRRRSTEGCWYGLLRSSESSLFASDVIAEKTGVEDVIAEYADVFEDPVGVEDRNVTHRIDLMDEMAPVPRPRIYRMSQAELAEVRRQLDDYLAKGWIRPSSSPYGHPILFVRKKTGELRMCIDFRSLNQNTRLDAYPIPRIDTLLDSLQGSSVFSILDLRSGYHQVPMEPGHEFKTAFTTQWGLFEFVVMPFGLCNAPATFQRLMNQVLRKGLGSFVAVYLDDILIYSPDIEKHREHLAWVLAQLREHKLYAKASKCEFARKELKYLGHVISAGQISMDPAKTEAISKWPIPTCQKEVQQFLGLANYYNKFVRSFATIAAPLSDLTGKKVQFVWSDATQTAFESLRDALCSADVLAMPDFTRDFQIETDASDRGAGAVLQQDFGRGLRPVAFFSRKFSDAEQRYPVHEREQLAIVLAVLRWRHYLDGKETVVITDHAPLIHMFSQPNLSKRQVRWMEKLAEFKLDVRYRAGSQASVPDALSRVDFCRLSSLIMEPGWLGRLERAQRDESDEEMVAMRRLAESRDDRYAVRRQGNLELVYRLERQSQWRRPMARRACLVVPRTGGFRNLLVSELHDSLLAGHLGARKTFLALSQRVWWPNMEGWVKEWVSRCPICQRAKDRTTLTPGQLQPLPIPEKRFDAWSMDFITHLPVSNGFNAIMTCVERLTKLVRVTPCKLGEGELDSVAVARIFFDRVVRDFGVPRVIVSDRDARFTSSFWQALFAIIGTKLAFSTAFHPQSDGQTERAHRVIEQVLRSQCIQSGKSEGWDVTLAHAEFALNSSPNASTKIAPFTLVYGQAVSAPVDHLDGMHFVQSAQDTVDQIRNLVDTTKKNLEKAQEYQKRYFDQHHAELQFAVEDRVLLSTKNIDLVDGKKLGSKWIGPFVITEKIGQQAYRLELTELYQRMHDVFHVSLLRPYLEAGAERQLPLSAPILTDLGQVEYEVERLLRHRCRKGRRPRGQRRRYEYLVKWSGYPEHEATWVPEDALTNAPERVANYWSSQPTI